MAWTKGSSRPTRLLSSTKKLHEQPVGRNHAGTLTPQSWKWQPTAKRSCRRCTVSTLADADQGAPKTSRQRLLNVFMDLLVRGAWMHQDRGILDPPGGAKINMLIRIRRLISQATMPVATRMHHMSNTRRSPFLRSRQTSLLNSTSSLLPRMARWHSTSRQARRSCLVSRQQACSAPRSS